MWDGGVSVDMDSYEPSQEELELAVKRLKEYLERILKV